MSINMSKKKIDGVPKKHRFKLKKRKPNRSRAGDFFLYLFLFLVAIIMVFPLVFAVSSALKPLEELFMFPPKIFARNPTLDNFADLFVTMGKSWVPFTRYFYNTLFITVVGTAGHLIIASMGAFVLAKYDFPGGKTFFRIVVVAIMFNGYVTMIPNYLILSKLHLIDTQWAVIIPAFSSPMGLFLMKQFMDGLPMSLVEAAKIDGATSGQILKNVTIPMVMPSITICTFLTLTNSFKLFDQNLALTNGEPSNMSELLALNIFRTFYGRTGWEGVGQAKAVVFFLLVAAIALTQNWLTRRKEVQQ